MVPTLAAAPARARWWTVVAVLTGLLGAGFLAALLLNAFGANTYTWFDNLAQTAAPVLAAAACALAALRHRGRSRLGWALLALSSLAWGAGQSVWDWYQLLQGVQTPFPSFADAGYLGAVPLALAGVLCFPVAARRASHLRSILDGLIVAGALLVISWDTVLGQVYRSGGSDALSTTLSLLYPLSDVAIITIVLLRVGRIPRGGSAPLLLLAAGLAANAVADSAFAYTTAANTYGSGIATDAGWVIGYLLIGLAALRAFARPMVGAAPLVMPSRVSALLPYPPVLAALGIAVGERVLTNSITDFTLVTLSVVVACVIARQYLVLSENVQLLRTLTVRERELAHQAHHDALTGLPNRTHFRNAVAHALDGWTDAKPPSAVLFVDLDDFKRINDTLGHGVGDRVLMAVAQRIRGCMRPTDVAARLGGDEFAVLIEAAPAQAQLDAIARRILQALREPVTIEDVSLPVRGTVGLAVAAGGADTCDELLRRADVAMYAAKREGKDRVGVYRALAA